MKVLSVQLFGVFREYVPAEHLEIKINELTTASQLKELIVHHLIDSNPHFQALSLVGESVLATHEEILQDTDLVNEYHNLALLPPVCGG